MKHGIWVCTFFLTLTSLAEKIHSLPVDLILPLKTSHLLSDRHTRVAEEDKNIILLTSSMLVSANLASDRKSTEIELEKINLRKILRHEVDLLLDLQQKKSEMPEENSHLFQGEASDNNYTVLAAELLIEHTEQIAMGRQFQLCFPEDASNNPPEDFNSILLRTEELLKKISGKSEPSAASSAFSFSLIFAGEEILSRQEASSLKKWTCANLQKTPSIGVKENTKSVKIHSLQQELLEFAENTSVKSRLYCNRPEGIMELERVLKKQVQIFNSSTKNSEKIKLQVLTDLDESSNSSNPNLRCLKILKTGGNL